jgi:diguanylate cyclase
LITRLTRSLEMSHKQWTVARKKDSLSRVLQGSRSSNQKLHDRLQQLMKSWESQSIENASASAVISPDDDALNTPVQASTATASPPSDEAWVSGQLLATVDAALPSSDTTAYAARTQLHLCVESAWEALSAPQDNISITTLKEALAQSCQQATQAIEHRQHLTDQLLVLCHELADSMTDLVEDGSWVQGQCDAVRNELQQGLSYRGTRRIQQLLEDARLKQKQLQQDRLAARNALSNLIHQMLQELSQLDVATGQFQHQLSGYADHIAQADSLESLAGLVRDMVQDSRTVHDVVSKTQDRLQREHQHATELTQRIQSLEQEIRQLSDEVSTDPLTQIANRRGLMRSFDERCQMSQTTGKSLCIGLLDVDNFKKLNDTLGHQTGDEALKFLSRRVSESLRPQDAVARYGGEEFVVLLPDTDQNTGVEILTRLQRQLSAEFFEHDEKQVFITFSAGVTVYREGEAIEAALDRSDMALYEAKRTGKNRTCAA